MRFDLTTPCKNCPFRNDETRITFACRERAEEIEEQAYREGFPCHLSAENVEPEDDLMGEGGFFATEESQQCAGHTIMSIKEGCGPWPSIDDEDLYDKLESQMDLDSPVFDGVDEFLDANTKER